jgi:hypothetical protein
MLPEKAWLSLLPFIGTAVAIPTPLGWGTLSTTVSETVSSKEYTNSLTDGVSSVSNPNSYTCYDSNSKPFPSTSDWLSFNTLWDNNKNDMTTTIKKSTAQGNVDVQGNTADENSKLKDAIVKIAGDVKLDARVVLAIVMQEVSLRQITKRQLEKAL